MRRLRTRLRTAGSGPFPGSALFINFSAGSTLDSRVTFSRGSNATLVDSTGKITYAPANLLLQSQDFDTASWSKTRTTVTANATVAPDGTSTADKLVEDTTASSTHFTAQSANYTAGTTYTLSVSVKAAGRNWFDIQLPAALMGTIRNAFFDVSNGTVGTVTSGVTAAIVSIGNGWYRCSVKFTPTASVGTGSAFLLANADNSISYTGDGTSGLFLWGAQLEPVTYQTTPSTYNVTTSAAYYGPRFDYDPVTLAAKGLLIEEARTNLLLYSEDLTNAVWVKSGSTATANTATSPAGTTTADRWEPTLTGTIGTTRLLEAAVVTIGAVYTSSAYVKAAGKRWVFFTSPDAANAAHYCWFDLQTGTVGTKGASVTTATITPAGDGWFRLTTSSTSTSATNYVFISATDADNSTTVTANGNAILIWGAQLEAGSFATSYIPTVASTVTRSADVATMTGTNFSSWYNQPQGTFVMDFTPDEGLVNNQNRVLSTTSGGVSNRVVDVSFLGTNWVNYNGTNTTVIGAASVTSTPQRIAVAYATANYGYTLNGGTVTTDSAALVNSPTQLSFGRLDTSGYLNGHIRQIAYYNTRLPNAQLQALTAPSMVTTLSLDFINGVYDA